MAEDFRPQALHNMGYRELEYGKWAKPFAYSLYTFEFEGNLATQWFRGSSGELCIWEGKNFDPENSSLKGVEALEAFLRNFEAQSKPSVVGAGHCKPLSFSTVTQIPGVTTCKKESTS